VIAQQVKEAMDELGVDFAGYQDHTIKGGCDVLTIGYTEFIGPLIKAVQELSAQVTVLEQSLSSAVTNISSLQTQVAALQASQGPI
jgi:phage shock protein A